MNKSTLATLLSAHAKGLAIAGIAVAATAGGGVAAITTVADSHAAHGLATAQAAQNSNGDATDTTDANPTVTKTPDATESEDATDAAKSDVKPTDTACPVPSFTGNHGAYVSGVAKSTSPGPDHGKAVSAAAQSDCGKPTPGASETSSSTAAAPTHSPNAHSTAKSNNRNNTHRNPNAGKTGATNRSTHAPTH